MSGTPLINSTYVIQTLLMIGRSDALPKATIIPIGNEQMIPTAATAMVSIKPPHLSVGTNSNPKIPPIKRIVAIRM